MRVLVIGSDVSAKSFAALFKHKRGEKVAIDLMTNMNTAPKTTSPSFLSPWLRNDAKGRWIALNFFRDILGSRREVIVSKIGLKSTLVLQDGKTEFFPSFFLLVRNLISFAIEPFRNFNSISINSDMQAFLSNRFGARFARKYSLPISTIFCGSTSVVSPMFVFPRIFSDCIRGHSVLLSPLRNWWSKNGGQNNTDYLNHDWQRCVSGGQFIQVDLGHIHAELDGYLKYMGVKRVERPKNFLLERDGEKVKLNSGEKNEIYDLVVTSDSPQSVWEYTNKCVESHPDPPEYISSLSRVSKLFSTMIFAKSTMSIKSPILWTPKEPILGSIAHSHLWDTTDIQSTKVEMSIISHEPVSAENITLYLESKFPHLYDIDIEETNSEEFVPSDVSPNRLGDLYAFHKNFRIPVFGSSLQVIGQYYYTPSGSIYDLVSDAKWLVDRIDARYGHFPKFIENELKSDWINRDEKNGFSLNGEYSDNSIVCAVQ